MKDVAAAVGVSAATVSNAYNRPDQLSGELRERVLEAARRLGNSGPDPVARGLRRRKAGAIGVLYPDPLSYAFEDPAAVLFLEGVSTAAEEAGLGMLLVSGASSEHRGVDTIGGAMVDGFVVFSVADDDPLVDAALGRRLPTVFVDQPPREDVLFVGIDDEGSAREAAGHLVGLGHERFGVLALDLTVDPPGGFAGRERQETATYDVSRARLRGYRAALESAGISPDVPVYECARNTQEQGRIAAGALLSLRPHPTALLVMSDRLALGVVEAARGMGLSVPGDLSVVGFDDIPDAARSEPPLTTVHQPHVEKGLRAGRLLVARIEDQASDVWRVLPTRLVVRGSTAPPGNRHGNRV